MKTNKTIQLSIPTPCSQNWEEMSVNDTGRFCNSCNKSVIDFTNYSDQQLADFFKRSKGNICGQFRNDQLEKPLYSLQYSQNRPFPPFLISAVLAIGLGNSTYGKGIHTALQAVHAVTNEEKEEMKNNPMTGDAGTHCVSGKIIDKATGEVLPGTTILIEGSEVGTASDKDGLFKLMIPHRLFTDTVKLVISCYGYASKTLNLPARDFPFHTIVELELSAVQEDVVIVVASGISRNLKGSVGFVTKKVRYPFLYRMKRWLRIKMKKNV